MLSVKRTAGPSSAFTPKPIVISDELVAKCSGPDQFENFDALFRSVIAVPKATVEKREAKWKTAGEENLKFRG